MDFPKDLFKNNHYAILGLGKNGIAASQRLLQMGATIQVWDDQPKTRQQIPEKLKPHLAPFKNLENFNALILSPGIPHFLPKPHPVAELAFRCRDFISSYQKIRVPSTFRGYNWNKW